MYHRHVGFTEFNEFYRKLTREGQVSRDEALERCVSDSTLRTSRLKKSSEKSLLERWMKS